MITAEDAHRIARKRGGRWLSRHHIIRMNQKDKVGRPDIDSFETATRRSKRDEGFFVTFDYTEDALREINRFFKADDAVIIPLTVQEILDEQIARKLA
jgi:hypothetical protein